jgi:hypothetical protein
VFAVLRTQAHDDAGSPPNEVGTEQLIYSVVLFGRARSPEMVVVPAIAGPWQVLDALQSSAWLEEASQPLAGSPSQSALSVAHVTISQVLAAQFANVTLLADSHTLPQAPQLSLSLSVTVSQPSRPVPPTNTSMVHPAGAGVRLHATAFWQLDRPGSQTTLH